MHSHTSIWLIITTLLVIIFQKRYFAPLLRPVSTIADVAMLVVGSERYLELARARGATGLREDKNFRTSLGWFRTRSGEIRWGIELADINVDFLTEEDVQSLGGEGAVKSQKANRSSDLLAGNARNAGTSSMAEAKPLVTTSQRETSSAWME